MPALIQTAEASPEAILTHMIAPPLVFMGSAYRADQIAPFERSAFPHPAQADALEI